jgi:ATP-binding cassette subfamily B protein
MMRSQPLLLILDEPTSALDAGTEHELFERYTAAARSAAGRGAVTLLVTHRFSTVSTADLVVVLHQGKVIEVGHHTELLAAKGRYAELYEIQARGYR